MVHNVFLLVSREKRITSPKSIARRKPNGLPDIVASPKSFP
jgi:hypothetical protein